ncbi:unnamed protein product [Calicophoron daubneyi]
MPTTQFGISPSTLSNARPAAPSSTPVSATLGHQCSQLPHVQSGKPMVIGSSAQQAQQHGALPHFPSPVNLRDSSPHRGSHNVSYSLPNPKLPQSSVAFAPSTNTSQLSSTAISNGQAAAMAAVAAAVAAQQRVGPVADSIFPPTAAAAAYFNAIASLQASSSSASTLADDILGAVSNSGYNEAMAALAAAGLYSLPTSLSSATPQNANSAGLNVSHSLNFGLRNSPTNLGLDGSFGRSNNASAAQATAAVVAALTQQQQQAANLPKGRSVGADSNNTIEPSLSLNQITNVASAGGGYNPQGAISSNQSAAQQQQQKAQQQLLCSLNVVNSLLPQAVSSSGSASDNSAVSTSTAPTAAATGSLLPPAPVSYRGSITTGQSAQQIQLQQQQQQQAHQKHLLAKYPVQSEYTSNRGAVSQQGDGLSVGSGVSNVDKSALTAGRLSEAAALMASIGMTNPSPALFNAAVLQAGLASVAPSTSLAPSTTSSSPVALTAVLAPYATDLNQLNYLTTATLAAAFQQQQQLQKNSRSSNNSPSPRTRVSPASTGSSSANTSSVVGSGRRFF